MLPIFILEQALTIEINPITRTIVQARGKRNALPSHEARRIMQKWAVKRYLTVGEGV